MKYIIVQHFGLSAPIVFPEILAHSDVAKGLTVTSAGFYTTDATGQVTTHGISESLRLAPADDDADLIQLLSREEYSHVDFMAPRPLADSQP